jgi:phosphoenolpyruvate carboxylase
MPETVLTSTLADASGGVSRDIRLLGRLLGDVIRAQAGDEAFELVESVRRAAVAGRRDGHGAIDELRELLTDRPISTQLHVIRAFDWLALLANTAEDSHIERRRRSGDGLTHSGTLEAAFQHLQALDLPPADVEKVLRDLQVSPVITAHPT